MKSTTLWLSSLVVALCAISWIVLGVMVQQLDGLLTVAHPMWQTIDWAMAVGPVMLMALFSCILFIMVLMVYRFWMNELDEQSMKMATMSPPPPPPSKKSATQRRKRFRSLSSWSDIDSPDEL
jgi:uncharacterized membrane protein YuzA (DUF378 family)